MTDIPAPVYTGWVYIIDTSPGRKLVRVVKVDGNGFNAQIAKLRATSLRWTRPEWHTFAALVTMNVRRPHAKDDADLLRAATKADDKAKKAAGVSRRLAVRR